MKKAVTLLLLLQAFLSCKGQSPKANGTDYVQKLEFGLKGAVKEVSTYICPVKEGEIPIDTAGYIGKIVMTFDSSGNALVVNKAWDFGAAGKSSYLSRFLGTGKDISFTETSRFNDGEAQEISYKYLWSDDYNYTIVCPDNSVYTSLITLDKQYRLIKSVFREKDRVQSMEDVETIYKDNKIQEIKTRLTSNTDGETKVTYQVQEVQAYDQYGNPTVIYGYNDSNKQKVEQVLYKAYKYY